MSLASASLLLSTARLGTIQLLASSRGLRRVRFLGSTPESLELARSSRAAHDPRPSPEARAHLTQARELVEAYLQGRREPPDLCLDLAGRTPFERRVLEMLRSVPFGTLTTYGEVARRLVLGSDWARAVGRAVGANPLPVVIPCHRVIRADGRLGGYSGGLERKVELLRLEGVDVGGPYAGSRVTPGALSLQL